MGWIAVLRPPIWIAGVMKWIVSGHRLKIDNQPSAWNSCPGASSLWAGRKIMAKGGKVPLSQAKGLSWKYLSGWVTKLGYKSNRLPSTQEAEAGGSL